MMKFLRALLLLLVGLAALTMLPAFAADSARKVKEQVAPVYPEMAKTMNISGSVRLLVTVTAQGTVKSTKVHAACKKRSNAGGGERGSRPAFPGHLIDRKSVV